MTEKRFKDFGSGSTGTASAEPLSFRLHGEEFSCVPQVQGKLMLSLVADAGSDDPAKAAQLINKFFKHLQIDRLGDDFIHPCINCILVKLWMSFYIITS